MKALSLFCSSMAITASMLLFPAPVVAFEAHNENSPCVSNNAELGDSAFWANTSLALYAQDKYLEAIKTVDACFNLWAGGAVTLQQTFNSQKEKLPPLGDFTPSEKKAIQENYLLNDVATALWVKARSLEEIGEIELAKKSYSNCIYLTHGRAWDPKGWFWSPSEDCIKRGRKLL
jgi:tetratricopeptide (TPR) repeat protein